MSDDDRELRLIAWIFGSAFAFTLLIALGIVALVAWVIIRVTLHFT